MKNKFRFAFAYPIHVIWRQRRFWRKPTDKQTPILDVQNIKKSPLFLQKFPSLEENLISKRKKQL